jgi:hypothetical protein
MATHPEAAAVPERTVQQCVLAHRQAWEALCARGLAGTRQLAPDLEQALQLIARSTVELNTRLDSPEGKRTAVGCARGEHAVLAEFGQRGLTLQAVRATALPTAVAQVIPDRPAGSGTAVSVPAELLPDQQGLTGAEMERALLRGATRGEDARVLPRQKRGIDRSHWFTLAAAARPQLAQRLADLLDSIRM